MAEYMVSFPAALLDSARELRQSLESVQSYLFSAGAQLPASQVMLLRGPGGIGKTHAIVDHALSRGHHGLRSLVFFGEDFSTDEPWRTMSAKTGFGSSMSRDSLFEMLDSAAEASGHTLIIYIDALNETQPDRTRWQSWLSTFKTQIRKYSYLKLCVSCRDSYLRDVAPRWEEIPNVEHNGFAGREFEAAIKFFQYYKLEAPTTPLLQAEFANPLFLHLVCQAAQIEGLRSLPLGEQGLSSVINLFLRAKNKVIAKVVDYDERENRTAAAVTALVAKMAAAGTREIPLESATAVVNALYPSPSQTRSLLNQLERESLIAVIPTVTSALAEPTYRVRFTFKRVADHLLVDRI